MRQFLAFLLLFACLFCAAAVAENINEQPLRVVYRDTEAPASNAPQGMLRGYDSSKPLETLLHGLSSNTYSPELAELLMAFAYSAYDNEACWQSYRNFDFEDIHFYSHNADTASGEEYLPSLIGVGFGHKQMDDSGKELVLISVRGTATGDIWDFWDTTGVFLPESEWRSDYNFIPNDRGWHSGFSEAADGVYSQLDLYLDDCGISRDNAVFVVCGHSRGAAVANLLSVLLTSSGVRSGNLYDYNFACPDVCVASTYEKWRNDYQNIFNINMAGDIISYVPGVIGDIFGTSLISRLFRPDLAASAPSMLLASWGKFGKSYWYSPDWNNPDETGLKATSHHQKNYLQHLARHDRMNSGLFKSWADSRVDVYRNTDFDAIRQDIMDYSREDYVFPAVERFVLEGTWILMSNSNRPVGTVFFQDGRTDFNEKLRNRTKSEVEDSYFLYPSRTTCYLVDLNSIADGARTYLFRTTDENRIEILDTNGKVLGELSRVTSDLSASQARPITSARSVVLVLDTSGSMDGQPLAETIKATGTFIGDVAANDANIGIVTFDSNASILSPFGSSIREMSKSIVSLSAGGGTNMGDGLSTAADMLRESGARKRIIVLMSDGEPETGLTGDRLVEYADSLKEEGILIYTLGFFSRLSNRANAQRLMERLASPGYHYEIDEISNLRFLFEDVSDQLSGSRYIFVRIECPVDVRVEYFGEVLDSSAENQNLRTSFGSLSFEDTGETGPDNADRRAKIIRLKEGNNYPIQIVGTGTGTMNYTMGLMDRNNEYTRFFEVRNVPITNTTVIETVAAAVKAISLSVDFNSDGTFDTIYINRYNGTTILVSPTIFRVIFPVLLGLILLFRFFGRSDVLVINRSCRQRAVDEKGYHFQFKDQHFDWVTTGQPNGRKNHIGPQVCCICGSPLSQGHTFFYERTSGEPALIDTPCLSLLNDLNNRDNPALLNGAIQYAMSRVGKVDSETASHLWQYIESAQSALDTMSPAPFGYSQPPQSQPGSGPSRRRRSQ